ncbi:hypothetical protein GCM10023340_19440 [Nocardioides marinquilinus]|uniref:Uncharacterized protein n=1 Tax=Nocardioides marinquilinus TaxID=1210400 RepID=A0ABP9PIR0_9ACTN
MGSAQKRRRTGAGTGRVVVVRVVYQRTNTAFLQRDIKLTVYSAGRIGAEIRRLADPATTDVGRI